MDGERKLCRQNNNASKRDCDRTTLNGSNAKKLWQRRRIETMQQLAYAGRESASYEVCIYWNGMAETDLKSVNFFPLVATLVIRLIPFQNGTHFEPFSKTEQC